MANVVARIDGAADLYEHIGDLPRILDAQHAIGALRQRRAGHDARALAGGERLHRQIPGLDVLDDL